MTKTITIKTINEFSIQEIFDYVALFLLKQNKQSIIETTCSDGTVSDSCRYRSSTTEESLKCAVGCLMSDEEYSAEYESKTIGWLCMEKPLFKHIRDDRNIFLRALQKVHDNVLPYKWYTELSDVARSFNLSTKAIDDYVHNKNTPNQAGSSEYSAS